MEYDNEAGNVTASPANAADDLEPIHYTYVGLPEETLWGLGALCTLTTLLSVIGNISVIIVLTIGKGSRTNLSKFLINLAVADLVMAVFCMPFTFTTAVNSNQWVFGRPMCTLVLYMQTASVTASVATSMVIAVDRYLAITRPLTAKAVAAVHGPILAGIWTVSLVTSAVQLFVARTQTVDIDFDLRVTVCQEEWPEPKESWTRGYTIFVFVVTYLFPLNIIAVTYVIVCRKLWNRKCPGNADHVRDSNQLRTTRKIVKMLVTVVTMFGVCWLPLHLFNIHQDLERIPPVAHGNDTSAPDSEAAEGDEDADDWRFAVFMMVHWLAMSSSCINPIIYGFLNDAFRSDLKHLASSFLSTICCRQRSRGPSPSIETGRPLTRQTTDSERISSARSTKETWTQDADSLRRSLTAPSAGNGSLTAVRASRAWRLNHCPANLIHHRQYHKKHLNKGGRSDVQCFVLTFLDAATPVALMRGQRLRTAVEDNMDGIEEARDIE